MNSTESLQAAKALLARTIELHPDPDAELLSMHAGACQAVEEAVSLNAGEGSGPGYHMMKSSSSGSGVSHLGIGGGSCDYLPRYRSPVVNGPTPYSCIGWEVALSGLAGRVPSPADTESPFSTHGGTFGDNDSDSEEEEGEEGGGGGGGGHGHGAIDLLRRPEGERCLSLLFGGLGDARQPLATFRDIYQQVRRSGGRLKYGEIGLNMILNDVKPECLTRAVVMFKALAELGVALQEEASGGGGFGGMGEGGGEDEVPGEGIDPLDLMERSDAVAVAVYRCYHLYLGAFLMPNEADWLQETLDEMSHSSNFSRQNSRQDLSSAALSSTPTVVPGLAAAAAASTSSLFSSNLGFSWLKIKAGKDRMAVKGVVERWRVMCKTMDPEVMAHIYQSSMQRPVEAEEGGREEPQDDAGSSLNGKGDMCGGGKPDAMDETTGMSLEQQWRAQVREAMLEQIEAMDDEEINQMREAEGETPEEKRAFLRDHWSEDVDPRTLDLMRHLPAAHREIEFFHTTMLLPVPPPMCARGMGLMDKGQGRALHNSWRPNVTLVSSDTPLEAMVPGKLEEDHALSKSLTALHFCPFKALKLLLTQPGDATFLARHEAFRSAAVFFSEVALGLAGFLEAGTLSVEMFLGDVHDLGSTRATESLDRVLISNVPDYTTLLPSMIKLLPLLKMTPGAALKHSVLKFNANFTDLPEYAHSMGLYVPDMSSLPTYLGVNHEYGGIWAHLVEWSRAPPLLLEGAGEEGVDQMESEKEEKGQGQGQGEEGGMPGRTSSPAPFIFSTPLPPTQHLPPAPDVQAWLSTVFLSIAMPLCRDCVHTHTEIRPLTLQAFFELCHYLVAHMDFPPHNLAWVIEHVMRGELKTSAVPPDATPWSPHYTWRQHYLPRAIPTGAFALETRTLAGLWQPKLGFRLCAPVGQRLPQPEDVTQLRLTVPWQQQQQQEQGVAAAEAEAITRLKATGVPLAKVVGAALLSPAFMAAHPEAFDPSAYHVPFPRHGSSNSLATSSFSSSPPTNGANPHPAPEDKGLRPLLLSKETQISGQVHLFSCVRWDSQTSLVTLLLPKSDLRELVGKGFHLCLLRTDSWHPLTKPFPLSDDPALLRPHVHVHIQKMRDMGEMEDEEEDEEGMEGGGEAAGSAMDVEGTGAGIAEILADAVAKAGGAVGEEGYEEHTMHKNRTF